jgi:hypothetical protein
MPAGTKPKDVAEWMMEQLRPKGARLLQPDAVDQILKLFGPEFVRQTDRGTFAIAKPVLRKFQELHGGAIVYRGLHRFWEKRD